MISNSTITWLDSIDPPWLALHPSRIGDVPSGRGTPCRYIVLELNGQPALRVDAYPSSNECFAFNDAVLWREFLVVGWGECVYLVDVNTGAITKHSLGMYFGYVYANDEYLLVASGDRLRRIAQDGSIQWTSDVLGIDGVVVRNVFNGIISGDGEWDPPGGWQTFRVTLDSGKNAN